MSEPTAAASERWTRRERVALALIVLLALALRAPSLAWGFLNDDHGLMLVLEGALEHPRLRWWSLFDFGGAAENSFLPWWTSPEWKVRFFRPLASATHALDAELFGRNAAAHHAAQLGWFALLLLAVARFYAEAGLSPRLALTALAVFALDDGSLLPTCWIANRNSLLESTFACCAGVFALRALRGATTRNALAALGAALASCACKESGLASFVLVGAIWLGWGGPARRRLPLWAALAALVACAYLAALLRAGFGASSTFYPTPWNAPLQYARGALTLAALGSLSLLGPFKVDAPIAFPQWLPAWLAVAAPLGALSWLWLVRTGRRNGSPPFFLCVWALASLATQAGTLASDRLLFTPLIGLAPWIAGGALEVLRSGAARAGGALLCLSALLLSPLALVGGAAQFRELAAKLRDAGQSFDVPRDGSACTAFVLQSGSGLSMLAPQALFQFHTALTSVRIEPLQAGRRALRWTRVTELEHRFESLDEPFVELPFETLFADASGATAERSARDGVRVEAERDAQGAIRSLRVEFDTPQAAAAVRWLRWQGGAFASVAPPQVGASALLERAEALDRWLP